MGDPKTEPSPIPHSPGDMAEDPTRASPVSPSPASSGREPGGNPGDQAEPGTPGTGENVCRHCRGTGMMNGVPCAECGGTGKVIEEIGGA